MSRPCTSTSPLSVCYRCSLTAELYGRCFVLENFVDAMLWKTTGLAGDFGLLPLYDGFLIVELNFAGLACLIESLFA